MFTNSELIEVLEISVKTAKAANILQKAKLIEQCVDNLLIVVKAQNEKQRAQTNALLSLKQDVENFKKRGFYNG